MVGGVGGRVTELVGARRLASRVLPVPEPGAGEVLVRTLAVGLCGTDLHAYAGRFDSLPVVLGHDAVGRVESVGSGVDGDLVGRRVTVDPAVACGRCGYCRAGRPGLCATGAYMGMTAPGAMAALLTVPADRVTTLPDAVSDVAGTVLEPVVVALRLLERTEPLLPAPGGAAVVVGGGPLGIVLAAVLRHRGYRPTVVEPVARRRATAGRLGLPAVAPDEAEAALAETGPLLVVETSAAAAGIALAERLATPGSVIGVVGRAPADVATAAILLKELAVVGVKGGSGRYAEAVDLVASGAVRPEAVVSHRFAFDEADRAFALAADRDGPVVRAVLLTSPDG